MKKNVKKILAFIIMVNMLITTYGAEKYNLSKEIEVAKVVTEYDDVNVDEIDTVIFGSYYQSEDYNHAQTKEPIEWIVLEKDKINRRALLLSKYILYARPYDYDEQVDWDNCSVNYFLNDIFIYEAFDKNEIKKINKIKDTSTEYGISFEEKVFLLDRDQAYKYFPRIHSDVSVFKALGDKDKTLLGIKSLAKATNYAKSMGVEVEKDKEDHGFIDNVAGMAFDNLLSPYMDNAKWDYNAGCSPYWNKNENFSSKTTIISSNCSIRNVDYRYNNPIYGVRPVLWVSY